MRLYDSLFYLSDFTLYLVSLGVALSASAAAMLLMRFFRHVWPSRPNAIMVSTTLSATVVPAALMLTFIANEVWNDENRARAIVLRESIAISESLKLMRHLPPELRDSLEQALADYARSAATADWEAMQQGSASEETDEAIYRLRAQLYAARQGLPSMEVVFQGLSEQLKTMTEAREMRHSIAQLEVSPLKWSVLLLLFFVNACTICELNRYSRKDMVTGLLLISFAFSSIAWLVLIYDRPFIGSTAIQPEMLTRALPGSVQQ
jgi:hypothetical protein